MLRIILTILLAATMLKVVALGGTFENACKCEFVKLSGPDEESENKKGTPEVSKYDNDDKLYSFYSVNSSGWYVMVESLSPSTHQKPHLRFSDKPNTPPPDLV
jgi:hypothetical protein